MIESIKGNVYSQSLVKPGLKPNKVAFTGSYTKEITEGLYHAKTIKFMESLKWLKGEIGGILITALGTGLVAPIFIGFNPFTRPPKDATPEQKEDFDNTTKYTAMRQPISAVLAILFQASVQKYIDKGLDGVFNNPKIAKYGPVELDQSVINTETRIKDLVKKEMKKEGTQKPSFIKALFSNEAKTQRKSFDEEFGKRVKAMQEDQLKQVAEEFEKTGLIKVGERHLDNKKVAKLVNSQIDEYIKDARNLQKSEEKMIPHYLERAEILTSNKDELRKILTPIIEKNSITMEQLDQLIATYKDSNPKLTKLIQEIKDKPEDLRLHRISRTLDRLDSLEKYIDKTTGKLNIEQYRQAMLDRNTVLGKIISELAGQKLNNPQAANESIIKETIEKIAKICDFSDMKEVEKEILKNTDTFGENVTELTQKVFKDISKRYKKLVSNHYTSWNQISKIAVGVFITLPITCTALNWVYPRFMEIFFPKLAGTKKAQQSKVGGDK